MFLDKEKIFDVVKANTLKVLPDLVADDVTNDKNLSDLGANSVDRVEVVIYSLEELSLKVIETCEKAQRENQQLTAGNEKLLAQLHNGEEQQIFFQKKIAQLQNELTKAFAENKRLGAT